MKSELCLSCLRRALGAPRPVVRRIGWQGSQGGVATRLNRHFLSSTRREYAAASVSAVASADDKPYEESSAEQQGPRDYGLEIIEALRRFAANLAEGRIHGNPVGHKHRSLKTATQWYEVAVQFEREARAKVAGAGSVSTVLSELWEEWPKLDYRARKQAMATLCERQCRSGEIKCPVPAELLDYRHPHEWFARARSLRRKIHLHIGPTNSGKTYQALRKLEKARSGVYAGPLRLLAAEVFNRMRAKGVRTSLVTGEQVIKEERGFGPVVTACTIEMLPQSESYEVAVIDEVQMMADPERGFAWTDAILGVPAEEVHLCGEERVLPMIQQMIASVGEELIVHRYDRLTPLQPMNTSLEGDLRRLRKGDCLVLFSRRALQAHKRLLEQLHKKPVAIIYGALPPQVRSAQAALFNDPDNDYDLLVASDAVGMGLNLNIKRMVFESTVRMTGSGVKPLTAAEIKQIGGRAGRFRVALPNRPQKAQTATSPPVAEAGSEQPGLVTSLQAIDLPLIRRAIGGRLKAMTGARFYPSDEAVLTFAAFYPSWTPLSYIFRRMAECIKLPPRFTAIETTQNCAIADAIQDIQGLSTADRLLLSHAPAQTRSQGEVKMLREFAHILANRTDGGVLEIKSFRLDLLADLESPPLLDDLQELELLHAGLRAYLWLSYRRPGTFHTQPLAFHVQESVEARIEQSLQQSAVPHLSSNLRRKREEAVRANLERVTGELDSDNDAIDAALRSTDDESSAAMSMSRPISPLDSDASRPEALQSA